MAAETKLINKIMMTFINSMQVVHRRNNKIKSIRTILKEEILKSNNL